MDELSLRAARGVALAALAVACVVAGPAPQVVAAVERLAAVAVVDDQRGRRGRVRGLVRDSRAPSGRGPVPRRPRR